jgi:hypothetical protein
MGYPLTFHGVPDISNRLAPLRRCLFPQGPSSHCPINGATVPAMSSVPHTGGGSNGIIWENAQDLPRAERGLLFWRDGGGTSASAYPGERVHAQVMFELTCRFAASTRGRPPLCFQGY